ncbi:hypothetical protein SAMN04489713_102364 [Actinomadura madurae]|uniref:Uncharacterized protein n=1 Tax=Actinomadura madurae TaxID=1993 RepID=A0A1I4ZX76_9ACTN|nr:hypothetical protein SAMN04489713_102364 [Actinomadura madurae]
MIRMTFRGVKAGMGRETCGGRAAGLRIGGTGEAIGAPRAKRTSEMGEAACSGRVTLYGGVV